MHYPIIIVGGGLAGLSLAILQARTGTKVLVLEKNTYPEHKVCGEYISGESISLLEKLGLPVSNYPKINQLFVSDGRGKYVEQPLSTPGLGISRYELDLFLYNKALESGVDVLTQSMVQKVEENEIFKITTSDNQIFTSDLVIMCHGKRSKIDFNLNRIFTQKRSGFSGIKYHIKLKDFKSENIELHNFTGGYCGISKVENDTLCLCYLIDSQIITKYKGDLKKMESEVLYLNPFLKKYFTNAEFLWQQPLSISQIYFGNKETSKGNILFCGDAAGMITPLCGNGMTIALQNAYLLHQKILKFSKNEMNFKQLKIDHQKDFNSYFRKRIVAGRWIQFLSLKPQGASILIRIFQAIPTLFSWVIRQTHGKEII